MIPRTPHPQWWFWMFQQDNNLNHPAKKKSIFYCKTYRKKRRNQAEIKAQKVEECTFLKKEKKVSGR